MRQPLAFLSYTRKDDEFFGGYITAFRKTLENAVHVVSGEETFRIFQDIEGIIIGETWKKKLAEVIGISSFLVPMLSPLFFNSEACRDEVKQFLEHERALERDDLILPVYFLPSAKIEKEEQRNSDPLVKELTSRQIFDWREKANVPLSEPLARKAVLELGGNIAKAIERLEIGVSTRAGVSARERPKRSEEDLAADPRLGAGVTENLKREEISLRKILWVDDNPDNNLWEQRALESYGVDFLCALDTNQAQQLLLEAGPFAAIISDMGRVGDPNAGFTLLEHVRNAGIRTPYFIYTTNSLAAKLGPSSHARGAQGVTANPDSLVEMVVAAIR